MKLCPVCNNQLEDNAVFCDNCGNQLAATQSPNPQVANEVICQVCGNRTSAGYMNCMHCGAQLYPSEPAAPAPKKDILGFLKAIPPKVLMFGGIGLAAAVVVIVVLCLLLGGGEPHYALYLQDGEIFYNDLSGDEGFEVSDRLGVESYGNQRYVAEELGWAVCFSEDGDTMFYPDRVSYDGSFTLYYRDVTDPEEEPVKVDSDVFAYSIDVDGEAVLYVKGDSRNLYYMELGEEKEKIGSNVDFDDDELIMNEDLSRVLYRDFEKDSYYCWELGEGSEKIRSDVELARVDEDLERAVFRERQEGENLFTYYFWEYGEETVKIASDIGYHRVINLEDGKMIYYEAEEEKDEEGYTYTYYYWELEGDTVKIADEVDVMLGVDEDFETFYYINGDGELYKSKFLKEEETMIDSDVAGTYGDVESGTFYYKKNEEKVIGADYISDEGKTAFKDYTVASYYTLCYYDDGDVTELTTTFDASMEISYEAPVLIGMVCDPEAMDSVKTADKYYDEVMEVLSKNWHETKQLYVFNEGEAYPVDLDFEAINDVYLNDETEDAYIICNYVESEYDDYESDNYEDEDQDPVADLYTLDISDGTVELFDTELYYDDDAFQYLEEEEAIVYFKDVEDASGELYIDGEKIDDDVRVSDLEKCELGYLYRKDVDNSGGATLVIYDGDAEEIKDDVYDYTFTPDGDILFLNDYSDNSYTGTLYLYDGGEAEKIADDISGLIPYRALENRRIRTLD